MRLGFVFILLVMFAACSTDKVERPPIPFEKMQALMTDIYVAEVEAAFIDSSRTLEKEKNIEVLSQSYASILNHYQVSFEEFKDAYIWYTLHPQIMDSLFQGMLTQNDSLQKVYDKLNITDGAAEELQKNIQEGTKMEKASMTEHEVHKEIYGEEESSLIRPHKKNQEEEVENSQNEQE